MIPGLPIIKTHIYMTIQSMLSSTVIYMQGKVASLIVKAQHPWVNDWCERGCRGKFSSRACVVLRFSCHASRRQGPLTTFHLCFSRSAAHPGEKGTLPLCQVDGRTPLSPATLFDPLSSVSSTRPPPVNSHCSDVKLYPRGESSRQQRPCDTKLWMNLSS